MSIGGGKAELVSAGVMSEGARIALVAVLCLAAVEKADVLRSGAAAWHPVLLRSSWRRRHATALMAAASFADLLAVALLVWRPALGAVLSAALVAGYTVAAGAQAGRQDEGCRCMWKLLDSRTATGLLVRNTLLVALSVPVAVVGPAGVDSGAAVFAAGALAVTALATTLADRAVLLRDSVRRRVTSTDAREA